MTPGELRFVTKGTVLWPIDSPRKEGPRPIGSSRIVMYVCPYSSERHPRTSYSYVLVPGEGLRIVYDPDLEEVP